MVVLPVGVAVVVVVLVEGFSDAHAPSHIMAGRRSSEARMIGLLMVREVLIADFGHDHFINHHVVAFS